MTKLHFSKWRDSVAKFSPDSDYLLSSQGKIAFTICVFALITECFGFTPINSLIQSNPFCPKIYFIKVYAGKELVEQPALKPGLGLISSTFNINSFNLLLFIIFL